MSDDGTIKLNYGDAAEIHTHALAVQGANSDALGKIKSSLASSVHIGVAGQTSDDLVGQLFTPYFNELNDIVAMFNNAVDDGMVNFNEIDIKNARRIAGAA